MPIHPKVAAGTAAGAATIILLGILDRLHLELSPAEAAAVATIVTTAASYMKKSATH